MKRIKQGLNIAITWLALLLIHGYQRWLSPYKGYSCAYRVYYSGVEGCSGYGHRVIRRYGVFTGYRLLQRRLWRCAAVAELLREEQQARVRMAHAQAGHCHLPTVDCDPSDLLGAGCNALNCASSSAGCGSSRSPKYSPMKYKPLPKKI